MEAYALPLHCYMYTAVYTLHRKLWPNLKSLIKHLSVLKGNRSPWRKTYSVNEHSLAFETRCKGVTDINLFLNLC